MNRKIGITTVLVTLILISIVFADILNYYGRIVATIIVLESPKWIQTTYDDFNAGIKTNVVVTNIDNGEVELAKTVSLDQSQTSEDKDSGKIELNKYEAQTFIAGKTGKLVSVIIKAKKGQDGNNPQPLVVELRNVDSGKPGNTILASAEIPHTNFTGSDKEYNFTFSTPPDVIAGTSYAIVIRQKSGGTADYKIRIKDKGNFYPDGARFKSDDGGSTWTEQTNDDIYFKTYVESYATSGVFESQAFDSNSASTKWKKLYWDADIPTGTSLKFQIATNNDGITWNFVGPDGSSSTYYTTSDSDIWSGHDNTRYIKFKAFFETTNATITPVLKEVIVFYLSD